MLKRLAHVCLGSSDLPRTIRFYQDMFGCRVAHEFKNNAGEVYGVFLFCNGGTFIEFFKDQEPKEKGGRFRHLCFEVESIEDAAKALRAKGIEANIKRGRTDHILQFFIEDPDGNVVEFQEHDRESALYPYLTKSLADQPA